MNRKQLEAAIAEKEARLKELETDIAARWIERARLVAELQELRRQLESLPGA